MSQYQQKISDILANVHQYHSAYYSAKTFGGPSLYFHRRSLDSRDSAKSTVFLEYIYATLASWGMHRMGMGGSKMQAFAIFKESIEQLREKIKEARKIEYSKITDDNWKLVEDVFKGIKIMASGTSIVGNSKVMAHLIPNIVPPIDREYTLKYLRGNTNIMNGLDVEWSLMKGILSEFFIPIAKDNKLVTQAKIWIDNQEKYPWDTSIFKVIDNLLIGAMQINKSRTRRQQVPTF